MRDHLTRSIEGMLAESGQPIEVTKALAAMTPAVEGLSPVRAQIPGSRVRMPRRVWV